jgi:HK97 family phage major capsid protein
VERYLEQRAPIMTADLSIPHFIAPPIEQQYASILVQLCNTMRVSSGVVDWVEIGPDPAAGVVAEGAAKPEAAITFTPKSAALDTLAHWVQITRQALSDASYMRSLVEGKLRRGLIKKLEADLTLAIVGNATIPTATNADLTAAIREAVGTVEGAGYNPNAVLLNPADYAELDVAAASAPGGSPAQRTRSYWGLTPVAVPSLAAGTAYVGDLRAGVTVFDRGVSDVFLTDSHQDLFIKNTLVILAETRVKSVVDEPLALCKTAAL